MGCKQQTKAMFKNSQQSCKNPVGIRVIAVGFTLHMNVFSKERRNTPVVQKIFSSINNILMTIATRDVSDRDTSNW